MRDRWYGDNRDLVKWGIIVHVAREYGTTRILQVAYFRTTSWSPIEIDGVAHPIPDAVIRHFRRVQNIISLDAGPRIEVLDAEFQDRGAYMQDVRAAILRSSSERTLVFLDPDTGLQPRSAKPEHVLESELRDIWDAMGPGDVLAFYQHQTNKAGKPWVEPKREQFEQAIGSPPGAVKVAWGPSVARDVVFFYTVKHETKHALGAA